MSKLTNFALSTVSVAPSPATSGTTLTPTSVATFPASAPFRVVAWPSGQLPTAANAEVMLVTGVSAGVWTVKRAIEGSTAQSIVSGYQVQLAETSAFLLGLNPNVYNVTEYGAVGDGATDDTAAIQACINDAPLGSTVTFPVGVSGVYLISAPIVFKSGLRYVGTGYSQSGTVVIRQKNGANIGTAGNSGLFVPDTWNANATYTGNPVLFENLTFDGNSSNNTTSLADNLVIQNFQATITGCYFINACNNGIRMTDKTANGGYISGSSSQPTIYNNYFQNCKSSAVKQEITAPSPAAHFDGFLTDNFINTTGGDGVQFDQSAGWLIRGNHFYSINGTAINAGKTLATRITENYIEEFGLLSNNAAPYYGYFAGIYANALAGFGTIISNNIVSCLEGAGAVQYTYIAVGAANNGPQVVVSGNNLNGAGSALGVGVQIQGTSTQTIYGVSTGNAVVNVHTPYQVQYASLSEDVMGTTLTETQAQLLGQTGNYVNRTANGTLTDGEWAMCTGGSYTLTLPASPLPGEEITITNPGNTVQTVNANTSQTIILNNVSHASITVSAFTTTKFKFVVFGGVPSWFVVSSTDMADMGGVLNNPTIASPFLTGGTTGFHDAGTNWYDVKAWGAYGDGVHDDAPAINALIAAIPGGKGTIFFPPGTYVVNSTISVSGKSIFFKGEGFASIIEPSASVQDVFAFTASANDSGISYLKIQSGGNGTGSAVHVQDSSQFFTNDMYVYGFKGWGFTVDGATLGSNGIFMRDWVVQGNGSGSSGYQFVGISANKYVVGAQVYGVWADNLDANNAFYFLNSHDILIGACQANMTGSLIAVLMEGDITAFHAFGFDVGSNGSYVLEINASGSTYPSGIRFTNCNFGNSGINSAIYIGGGSNISFDGCGFNKTVQWLYVAAGTAGPIYVNGGDSSYASSLAGNAASEVFVADTTPVYISNFTFGRYTNDGVGYAAVQLNVLANNVFLDKCAFGPYPKWIYSSTQPVASVYAPHSVTNCVKQEIGGNWVPV